jgi:CRP/FNR family cyclic AMP-dependent transcriptional regulator
MEHTADVLSRIPLFAQLSAETLARLAQVARPRRCEPGELILLEGAPCQAGFVVAAGQVRVYRVSAAGREQVLVLLGAGEAFNTVPLFQEHGVNHASAEAVTPATLYVFPRDDLRRLAAECPDLALTLLQDFADKLDHLTDLVEDLALRTVRGRLARFLLQNAEQGQVARSWTQDEIAAQLGTVRDMVGRTLRAFADAGLLRLDRQRIVLLDREGLQREAEG